MKVKLATSEAYHSKRLPQIWSSYAFEKKTLEAVTQQYYDAWGT